MVGFEKELTHLDNRTVSIKRDEVTPYGNISYNISIIRSNTVHIGYIQTIEDEGMPIHEVPSDKGNLILTYKIKFPKKLSEDQKSGKSYYSAIIIYINFVSRIKKIILIA